MKYFTLLFIIFINLLNTSFARDVENQGSQDIGIATVWAIGQVSEGAYIKTGLYAGRMYNSTITFGEIEAAWRFTRQFSFGLNLRPAFTTIKTIDSKVVLVGFLFGYRNNLPNGFPYAIELNTGTIDIVSKFEGRWFIETGFRLIKRNWRVKRTKLSWTGGLSYRYVLNNMQSDNIATNLSGLGINVALGFGKY